MFILHLIGKDSERSPVNISSVHDGSQDQISAFSFLIRKFAHS